MKKKKKKILKKDKRYYVYHILHNNKVIYVGQTDNLKRRQSQHNRALKKLDIIKDLYVYLRDQKVQSIELVEQFKYEKRADAKRREALLILMDYFGNKKLLNRIPNISDR